MYTLYDQVRDKELAQFDDFYQAIEGAVTIPDIKVFRLKNGGKEIIGLRIHPDEIVWRLPRDGEKIKRRARDNWFYFWKTRILNYVHR